MGQRSKGCKRIANNALLAGRKKRQRIEHVRQQCINQQPRIRQEHIQQLLVRTCSNCQRTELHEGDESLSLTRISEADIQQNKRGKFSMLAGQDWDDCYLCSECWKYFCGEKLIHGTAGGVVWPSFVWKSLISVTRDQRLTFWSCMPEGWRLWWLPKARRLDGLRYATVLWPKAMIEDATAKIKEINIVKEELKWKDIEKTWDELCCSPFVHCPWGCSEFYHMCNDLPFDAFVISALEESLCIYLVKSDTYWTRGIRKDFLTCEVPILDNPDWLCRASLVMSAQKGPRLLCCCYHSKKTIYDYVHACRNPATWFNFFSRVESDWIGCASASDT